MKKTLTINLGGTVYHIDEDANMALTAINCHILSESR